MAYDLVLYSVLVNMNPINKLYCFDWIILINAEYVVYIMCVCVGVLICMWFEYIYVCVYIYMYRCVCVYVCIYIYIYILLYIRYQFFIFPFLLLISCITIIHITIYFGFIASLFYSPIIFFLEYYIFLYLLFSLFTSFHTPLTML